MLHKSPKIVEYLPKGHLSVNTHSAGILVLHASFLLLLCRPTLKRKAVGSTSFWQNINLQQLYKGPLPSPLPSSSRPLDQAAAPGRRGTGPLATTLWRLGRSSMTLDAIFDPQNCPLRKTFLYFLFR